MNGFVNIQVEGGVARRRASSPHLRGICPVVTASNYHDGPRSVTRQQILDAILPLNGPENALRRLQWLIDLGYYMTISARAGYPTVENKIEHLVAFNELQHQLYNQMLHCQTNDEWYKVEELLENLRKYADGAGVAGDFGWAAQKSVRSLVHQ